LERWVIPIRDAGRSTIGDWVSRRAVGATAPAADCGDGRESMPGGALDEHGHEDRDPGSTEPAGLLLDDLVDDRGIDQVVVFLVEPVAHAMHVTCRLQRRALTAGCRASWIAATRALKHRDVRATSPGRDESPAVSRTHRAVWGRGWWVVVGDRPGFGHDRSSRRDEVAQAACLSAWEMIWILLAALGVLVWLAVGGLVCALWSRRTARVAAALS